MKGFLRIFTALVFLTSGFVKAVDPVGFSFKLEEYFSPAVFGMPFFEKFALPIGIFVIFAELILGMMLLLKIRLRFTLSALIVLCVFFAFLTFYSAYFQVVTDCGCFGDAVKFTPWQSFGKDVFLLILLVILWFLYRRLHFHTPSRIKNLLLGGFVLLMIGIMMTGIFHEPLIDFRDYKIGTNLKAERQKIAENPSVYKTFYTLRNKKTSEEIKMNQDEYVAKKEYWQEGTPWEIVPGKDQAKIVKAGYSSEIAKFRPETPQGEDISEKILASPHAILLFSYNPQTADKELITKTENLLSAQNNALVLGISTGSSTFKKIPNAVMDGTAIKTIARSNPFVLTLQNGVITDKQSAADYLKNQKN